MKFLIVIEKIRTGYAASPDLDGCVATGRTRRAVEEAMHDAPALHLEALRADGEKISVQRSYSTYVELGRNGRERSRERAS